MSWQFRDMFLLQLKCIEHRPQLQNHWCRSRIAL